MLLITNPVLLIISTVNSCIEGLLDLKLDKIVAIKLLIKIYEENEFDKLGDSAAGVLRELGIHSYYGL